MNPQTVCPACLNSRAADYRGDPLTPVPCPVCAEKPLAWFRGVRTADTPDGPGEYDEECVAGSDQPPGSGWIPLYAAPAAPAVQPADVPVPWQSVVKAIQAVDDEARRRGEMFPQCAEEHREDRRASFRVWQMIEWYATKGGAVAEKLRDWPRIAAAPAAPAAQPEGWTYTGDGPLVSIDPKCRAGKEPCGECHIKPGETCCVCGASVPPAPEREGGA